MVLRANLDDLPPALREQAKAQLLGALPSKPGGAQQPPAAADETVCPTCGHKRKKRRKYRAQRTKIDNIWFDSKKEALRYLELVDQVSHGLIKRFHRQVPIDLPGGVSYVIDFLIVQLDDSLVYEDVKGIETPVFKLKLKQAEERLGAEIRIT